MSNLGGPRKPGARTETASAPPQERAQSAERAELAESGSHSIQDGRFRAFAAATGQIIWSAAPDGALQDAASWRAFTGQRETEALGWGWLDAVHPEDRTRAEAAWRRALAEQDLYEIEYRLRRFDGVYRDFLVRAAPLLDATGAVCEWIGFCADITQRGRSEQIERERLLREREEARAGELAMRQAKREMDEFLSVASHELRTPLTSIRGFLQLAEQRLKALAEEMAYPPLSPHTPDTPEPDGALPADRFERVWTLLERAEFQTGQMSRLINELLDASRVHASRLDLRLARHDLAGAVRDIVEEQRLVWPARVITLEAPDEPVPVMMDAARISQALANLLTNALKYAPAGHPVIVGLCAEAHSARVAVRDFGPGLASEEQGRIWERFYRSKQVRAWHGADGLGLGLYISRAIVERHGGRVGVQSRPGEGATFFFVLPLADSQ